MKLPLNRSLAVIALTIVAAASRASSVFNLVTPFPLWSAPSWTFYWDDLNAWYSTQNNVYANFSAPTAGSLADLSNGGRKTTANFINSNFGTSAFASVGALFQNWGSTTLDGTDQSGAGGYGELLLTGVSDASVGPGSLFSGPASIFLGNEFIPASGGPAELNIKGLQVVASEQIYLLGTQNAVNAVNLKLSDTPLQGGPILTGTSLKMYGPNVNLEVGSGELKLSETLELRSIVSGSSTGSTLFIWPGGVINAKNVELDSGNAQISIWNGQLNASEAITIGSQFEFDAGVSRWLTIGSGGSVSAADVNFLAGSESVLTLHDTAQLTANNLSFDATNLGTVSSKHKFDVNPGSKVNLLSTLDSSGSGENGQLNVRAYESTAELNIRGSITGRVFEGFAVDSQFDVNLKQGGKITLQDPFQPFSSSNNYFRITAYGTGRSRLNVDWGEISAGYVSLNGQNSSNSDFKTVVGPQGKITTNLFDLSQAELTVESGGKVQVLGRSDAYIGGPALFKAGSLFSGAYLNVGYGDPNATVAQKPKLTINGNASFFNTAVGRRSYSPQSTDATLEVGATGRFSTRSLSAGLYYERNPALPSVIEFEDGLRGAIRVVEGGRIWVGEGATVNSLLPAVGLADNAVLSIDALSSVNVGAVSQAYTPGALTLGAQSSLPVGNELSRGYLAGRGTVNANVINNGGLVDPGFSPGRLTVNGNYTQNSGSVLFELGGLTAGTEYDQLKVSGDVKLLGGTIELRLINGFTLTGTTNFELFTGFSSLTLDPSVSFVTSPGLSLVGFDPLTGRFQVQSQPVPEPASMLALGAGVVALLRRRRRG